MIVTVGTLGALRLKYKNKRIVFADGTFDLFHLGHVAAIKNLHTYGDLVVVGVLCDEWVKMNKGDKRPILNEKERVTLVDSLKFTDYVVLQKDVSKRIKTTQILEKLKPDVFVSLDKSWNSKKSFFKEIGVELKIVKRINSFSTTKLLERISVSMKK